MILSRIKGGLLSKLKINMKDKIFIRITLSSTTPGMYIARINKAVTKRNKKKQVNYLS